MKTLPSLEPKFSELNKVDQNPYLNSQEFVANQYEDGNIFGINLIESNIRGGSKANLSEVGTLHKNAETVFDLNQGSARINLI